MQAVTVYHNPRCSKSRAVLALLEENDIEADVIDYIESPPDVATLKSLVKKLGVELRDILRRNEPEYDELGLDDMTLNEAIVLDLVSRHPQLIQRPIIVQGDKAIIGRPPENVLTFLEAN